MSSRSRANTGQRPPRSPSAASLSRTRASSGTSSPASGSRAAKAGQTAGTPVGSAPGSVTCRLRQRRLVSSSRARPAISAGDMLASRRAYHRRFTSARAFVGRHGLQAAAAQAAPGGEGGQGRGRQRGQRDGHGPRLGDGADEGVQLLPLALVDAGAGAADVAAAAAPQLGALEVVQPGHLPVPVDLEQLLGRAGVAAGLVGDGGDRPVGVQQRGRGVVGVAGGGGRTPRPGPGRATTRWCRRSGIPPRRGASPPRGGRTSSPPPAARR